MNQTALPILVVEGNTRAARERMISLGAATNSELYVKVLRSCNPAVQCDIICPTDADAILPSGVALEQYAGIAWTGSALNAYDPAPEVRRQIEFARAVYRSQTPFFGSCWALQIATVAAGGEVGLNRRGRELGIARKITLTPTGQHHFLFRDRPITFDAVCVHQDEVHGLPPGATVLAYNAISEVQAVEIRHDGGMFCGVQYHPEFDLGYIAAVIRRIGQGLIEEGFFRTSEEAEQHTERLLTLAGDPGRKDIAWLIGADAEVLDPVVRLTEVRNWLKWLSALEK